METLTPASSSPEVSVPELRQIFGPDRNLEGIEALRARQREAYTDSREANKDHSDEVIEYYAAQAVGGLVIEYLERNGIDEKNLRFAELRDGLMELSILNIPDTRWGATWKDEDEKETGLSGRDNARALFQKLSGESYYDLTTESTVADQEALADWHTELDTLRDTFAACSASRQGRVFGKGGEKYAEAKQAYNEQLIALAKLENESIISDTEMPDDEIKLKITEYLFDEQAKLRSATTEKLKGTKVGRFVETMNRGNIAIRIAKGLALGVGVGLAGAGIGALAGAAGVATIGAGVAAVGTATVRFARGFARKDAKAGRGMAELDQSMPGVDFSGSDNGNEYVDSITQHLDDLFEKDTKLEQKKRRSSIKWGIGALAIGVVAAEAGQLAVDTHWFDGLMSHHDSLMSGGRIHGGGASSHSPVVLRGAGSGTTAPSEGLGLGQVGNVPSAPLSPEFSVDAYTVARGEGWYQTFKDMGITNATEQANLLQKVGPKLQEMGLAYKIPHGLWGISHPGQLPNDVLELINNSR